MTRDTLPRFEWRRSPRPDILLFRPFMTHAFLSSVARQFRHAALRLRSASVSAVAACTAASSADFSAAFSADFSADALPARLARRARVS
ncbi:MAG TPA: hypothetical protein VF573_00210, partial [Paraburkholderia sp.]|uniref:hypothetical protein n=1 Tax=Paraburkholderia sp. TaxID=1926495 RepID=UPI002ED193D6